MSPASTQARHGAQHLHPCHMTGRLRGRSHWELRPRAQPRAAAGGGLGEGPLRSLHPCPRPRADESGLTPTCPDCACGPFAGSLLPGCSSWEVCGALRAGRAFLAHALNPATVSCGNTQVDGPASRGTAPLGWARRAEQAAQPGDFLGQPFLPGTPFSWEICQAEMPRTLTLASQAETLARTDDGSDTRCPTTGRLRPGSMSAAASVPPGLRDALGLLCPSPPVGLGHVLQRPCALGRPASWRNSPGKAGGLPSWDSSPQTCPC